MKEEIKILKEFIEQYNASYPDEKEWVAIYPNQIQAIQGLLDLYEKEKEKNKELLEGLKYRVNYCKLLEKELYEDTDMEYEMELTKIEQKYIQELLNKEDQGNE